MKIEIVGGNIIITAPIDTAPKTSKTGKSLLLVNTGGFFKPGLTYEGKPVSLSLNVIIPK